MQLSAMSCMLTLPPSPAATTAWFSGGKSAPVMTALTPGRAIALLMSMRLMRACGCGLRTTLP